MRCAYCEERYKDELIDAGDGIGEFIDGFWFCGWCSEYGFQNDASGEKERCQMLVREAEQKNFSHRQLDI